MTSPSSSFMNWFWDLASDETSRRLYAGTMIIKHIQSTMNASSSTTTLSLDGEYALKRLIRGVSSSRDSARQGFSSCLCQLYQTFPFIEINKIISIIEESTKPTGPMKGSEERDVMFGRLFNYLAIIRSGKIQDDSTTALYIFDRFIELHKRKIWIREVVTEAILLLFEVLPRVDSTMQSAIQKLKLIIETDDLDEMPPHDLILFSGLQTYSQTLVTEGHANLSHLLNQSVLPIEPVFSPENFPSIEQTLLNACHGFPKIHRVWTSLTFAIFGCSEGRSLPSHRATSLSTSQLALLTKYMDFITTKLLPMGGSHERKSVAYYLIIELTKLIPISSLPLVLTPHIVRNIINVRFNQKNTLHDLSRHILKEIVNASSYPCVNSQDISHVKLTIANILTASGSAEFDNLTQTTTISTLLSELNLQMILEYIESLCDVMKSSVLFSSSSSSSSNSNLKENNNDQEEENSDNVFDPSSCIYSLYAIIKNPKLVERGTITAVVLGILLRLSCYGEGITPDLTESLTTTDGKKKKKSTKKTSSNVVSIFTENGIPVELATRIITLIRRVEGVIQGSIQSIEGEEAPPSSNTGVIALVRAARSRCLTILSDLTYQTIDGLNKSNELNKSEEQESKTSDDSSPTFLQFAYTLFQYFESSGLVTHKQLSTPTFENVDEADDEEEDNSISIKDLLNNLKITMNLIREQSHEAIPQKLAQSFEVLLIHTTFHIFCSDEIDVDPLRVIIEVLPQILEKYKNKTSNKSIDNSKGKKKKSEEVEEENSEDEDDEDDDDPQAELLDCCMDLLAVSASHSIKGIRDAIKKIWMSIIHYCGLHQDGLEAVLLAVIAEDTMNDEQDEGEGEGEDDNDSGDGESDHDVEKNEGGEDDENEDEEEEENDDDDDEEENSENGDENNSNSKQKRQVTEEEVMQLLEENGLDLDEDDDENAIAHIESADDALVQMIKLRQQSRKQGLLQAKRQEFIIRSRAVDILEVFLHRNENSSMIIPLFRPLLFCLKKISTSSLCQSLPEGRAFQQRLKTLIETKLSKLKFSLPPTEGSEEFDQFMIKTTNDALEYCNYLFNSPDSTLRNLSYQSYFCITRSILTGKNLQIKEIFHSNYQKLISDYFFLHKNHFLTSQKILDEYLGRYPDGILSLVLETLIKAMIQSKTSYLQSESFRLLEVIVKRFQQLEVRNKQQIVMNLSKILKNIVEIFQLLNQHLVNTMTTQGNTATNNTLKKKKKQNNSLIQNLLKVKRFKPFLQLIKIILNLFKSLIYLNKNNQHYELHLSPSSGASSGTSSGTSPSSSTTGGGASASAASDVTSIPFDSLLMTQLRQIFISLKSEEMLETKEGLPSSLLKWINSNVSLKNMFEQISNQFRDIPLLEKREVTSAVAVAGAGTAAGGSTKIGTITAAMTSASITADSNKSSQNKSSQKEKKNKNKEKYQERDYERELILNYKQQQQREEEEKEELSRKKKRVRGEEEEAGMGERERDREGKGKSEEEKEKGSTDVIVSEKKKRKKEKKNIEK